jgi:hypothetical protein
MSAALMLLALGPATALARHHHPRRHHSRVRHALIERFGRDVTSAPMSSTSSEDAGTVQSFSGGMLTLMLADGSTVSGMVTGATELECRAPDSSQTIHEDGDGGSGDQSGDGNNSGSGDDQAQGSGGDQGDTAEQNEDQGEDDAENNCSMANLTPATAVREAELRISGTGAVWKKVELGS